MNDFYDEDPVEDAPCPKCKVNPAQESHTCPYQQELSPDPDSCEDCNCCEDCQYECAMDV